MKISRFLARGSNAGDGKLTPYNHFWIDIEGDDYLELVKWLRGMDFQGYVDWFPKYVNSEIVTGTMLEIHVRIEEDRDTVLFRLSV